MRLNLLSKQKAKQYNNMNVKSRSRCRTLSGLVFLMGALPIVGQELTIDWGTDFFPSGPVITSSGAPIELGDGSFTDDGFTIELGVFDGGFTPTTGNTESWVTNWRALDAITANDPDSRDNLVSSGGGNATFSGTDLIDSTNRSLSLDAIVDNDFVFSQGTQTYVFVRNGDTPEAGTEWLLYTRAGENDDWTIPFVSPESHSPADDLTWSVTDANTAIWGAINGETIGGGESLAINPTGLIQTFTFVPEPSSALLVTLGGLALLRRRR